ncbi:MAG: acyl-CoA desaturase [Acidobacteria bacterium]|nr:MAG: acyl-CoA desaturase [Acidobacteriota bacterium]
MGAITRADTHRGSIARRSVRAVASLLATRQIDTRRGETPDLGRGFSWLHLAPYVVLHAGCLGVLWVGWSPFAVGFAVGFYLLRAFFVTAFYHRYFSHRAFRTSRGTQFVFAVLGNTAVQRGPLWWASHHRRHHRHTDSPGDPHSPVRSFLWSHLGWLTAREHAATDLGVVPDLARFPELRWLDRWDTLVPALVAVGTWGLGSLLAGLAPSLGTDGPQMLVWGFFVSTVILFHVTCMVNSVAHLFGSRPYDTGDESRNNWLVATLSLGEGWHNNHHFAPGAARQGFRAWEIDPTWWGLRLLERLGVISGPRPVPARARIARRRTGRSG